MRREFPSAVKRDAYKRSGGICECHRVRHLPTYRTGCKRPLSPGNTFYEHIDQDALGGGNDLSNCDVLTKTCWTLKTARIDLPAIAKNNRQRDLARGIERAPYRPLPGTKRSGIKLPFRGKPIDRRTGEPLRWR